MNSEISVKILSVFAHLVVESMVVLLLGLLWTRFGKRHSAGRHLGWAAVFVVLALLPPLLLIPSKTTPPAKLSLPAPVFAVSTEDLPAPLHDPMLAKPLPKRPATIARQDRQIDWFAAAKPLLIVWLTGTAVVLSWIGFAFTGLIGLYRKSRSIPWEDGEFEMLSDRLKVRRKVGLRQSTVGFPHCAMTWGILRPRVLLPLKASEWTADQRETILLHELAHVKRYDAFWQLLVGVASAWTWFNPLVWTAGAALRSEAEAAADDMVIHSGILASEYAAGLLYVSASYKGRNRSHAHFGIGMARNSNIKDRIKRVLDPLQRRNGVSPIQVVSTVAIVSLILAGVFILRPLHTVESDVRESLFDQAVYQATQHERESLWKRLRSEGDKSVAKRTIPKVSIPTVTSFKKNTEIVRLPIKKSARTHLAAVRPRKEVGYLDGPETRSPKKPAVTLAKTPIHDRVVPNLSVTDPSVPAVAPNAPSATARLAAVPSSIASSVLAPFHSIVVGSGASVTIRVGLRPSIKGAGSEDVPGIDQHIQDGVLHLENGTPSALVVDAPAIDDLEVTGASSVTCTGVNSASFLLQVRGASSVVLSGRAKNFDAQMHGSSAVDASHFVCNNLRGEVKGSSRMAMGETRGDLQAAVKSGSQFDLGMVRVKHFALAMDEGSRAVAAGTAKSIVIASTHGSRADLFKLVAQDVTASASEGAQLVLFAIKRINATATEGSTIKYSGNPVKPILSHDEASVIEATETKAPENDANVVGTR